MRPIGSGCGRTRARDGGQPDPFGLACYFVVTPPDDVAPVEPAVPELLLVPALDGEVEVVPDAPMPDVGGEAVPLTEPPAEPIPDAVPEAEPDTGPVLHAARAKAQASAVKTLIMVDSPM